MRIARWLGLIMAACSLAGCAAGPDIVVAYAQGQSARAADARVLRSPRYRFAAEATRAGQPNAAQLDALAQDALASIGAVRDDAHPNVSVQVTGTVQAGDYDNSDGWGLPADYWGADHYLGFGAGVGEGWAGRGGHEWFGQSPLIPIDVSTVTLTMRDLATGQVVYRTSARHRGIVIDTHAVLAALFQAALQGYPKPPAGVRRIVLALAPSVSDAAAPAPANPRRGDVPAPGH